MELKHNGQIEDSAHGCLNRTFYGIETIACCLACFGRGVLIVPFMELKLLL